MAKNDNKTPRQPEGKKRKQGTGIAYGLIGTLLMMTIVFQAYKRSGQDRMIAEVNAALDETERLRQELEARYHAVEAAKQVQQVERDELRKKVAEQQVEMSRQEETIRTLMQDKRRLVRAKEEVTRLKEQVNAYLEQVTELEASNKRLAERDRRLQDKRDSLSEALAVRQSIMEQQMRLLGEQEQMSKQLGLAAVIKMKAVTATGQRIRSNGRVKEESDAGDVDQLLVCFTTMDNEVVRAGMEQFHVRVINPVGETLAMEDMGSGFFTDRRSGQKIRFTRMESLAYNNKQHELCMLWAPANPSFLSGEYRVEIYNKGYLAGMSVLTLR